MLVLLYPLLEKCGGAVFYATPTLFLHGKLDTEPILANEKHMDVLSKGRISKQYHNNTKMKSIMIKIQRYQISQTMVDINSEKSIDRHPYPGKPSSSS